VKVCKFFELVLDLVFLVAVLSGACVTLTGRMAEHKNLHDAVAMDDAGRNSAAVEDINPV
jgi:hypothetical protein